MNLLIASLDREELPVKVLRLYSENTLQYITYLTET